MKLGRKEKGTDELDRAVSGADLTPSGNGAPPHQNGKSRRGRHAAASTVLVEAPLQVAQQDEATESRLVDLLLERGLAASRAHADRSRVHALRRSRAPLRGREPPSSTLHATIRR